MKSNPLVSIIIPTLNADGYFSRCLESIERQDFDKKNLEILILDGGSKDKTLDIAKEFETKIPIKVINNERVDAESGKYKGILNSKGEIIALLDSDNEIVRRDWLSVGFKIMREEIKLWGLESPWIYKTEDSFVNHYFTLLKIADPVARMLNPKRKPIESSSDYEVYEIEKKGIVVTGANGFFWRRSVILKYLDSVDRFEEVNFASIITEMGVTCLGKLKNNGIYHYYCDSILKYLSKRVKIAKKFNRRKQLKQKTWVDNVSRKRLLFAIIYCATILFPTLEAIFYILKTKKISWVIHPFISFITVTIYGYSFLLTSSKKFRKIDYEI